MNILLRLVAASCLAGLTLAAPALGEGMPLPGPESATGSYLAGQLAINELRTHEAAAFFADAAKVDWDNPAIIDRAFVALAADGQVEAAVEIARHVLDIEPDNQLAKLVIATQAVKQRRYDAAISGLNRLGADTFEGITGSILKAWAMTGKGNLDEAFKSLDKVGQGGLDEFLVFHRAIMADVAGNKAEAADYIGQALETGAFEPDVVEAYARILGNAGQYGEAIDAIVNYESQGLESPLIDEVKTALASKRPPGMFADSVQAGAAEMFHSVGVAFARDGTNDVSMVLLRLGAYLDPRNDTIAMVIGQLYDAANQHEAANEVYDAIPNSSPLKAMATVRVADNLDALGNRPEAIRRLGNIVTSNPGDIDAISVLGDLLRTDEQFQPAIENYTKALALTGGKTPGDWRLFYVRGIAYEESDQFALAEKDFLKALDLSPAQPQVLNYLGYSWVDKNVNLTRALDMIKKAVAASPNDAYIIDSLGWAYYRLGRYDDAVTELLQAVALRPNDAEINDHLGDAYWRVGRHLEAHFQWNVAYAMDTEGKVKKRVEPKLTGGLDAAGPAEVSAPAVDKAAAQQASPN